MLTTALYILFQERFGVPYSFCSGTKAGLKPTEYSSLKGSERQIVGMGPIYLGREHGLVDVSSSECSGGSGDCAGVCAGTCTGNCAGSCASDGLGKLVFFVFVHFHLDGLTLIAV